MGDPDYRYQPMPQKRRDMLSVAQRRRWGAPEGMATVRGVHVPLEYRDDLKLFADRIAASDGKHKAQAWVQSIKDDDFDKMAEVSAAARDWRIIAENRELIRWLPYGGEL